jgi:hypothetical protein
MRRLMWLVAAAALYAGPCAAAAQQLATIQTGPCQKFAHAADVAPSAHEILYLQAACVAARAGVAAPANGPLSREELLSILMLMSLQQSPPSHSS